MTEEAFAQAEDQRRITEAHKNAVKAGVSTVETVEVDPTAVEKFEVKINNSAVREIIRDMIESYFGKQTEAIKLFEAELQNTIDKLSELIDNFNLYVAEERKDRVSHRERVKKAAEQIERELNY